MNAHRFQRRALSREATMGIVAALLLVAAAVVYFKFGGEERATGDDMPFTCQECKNQFKITPDQLNDLIDSKKFKASEFDRAFFIKCPKCGKMSASKDEVGGPPTAP